VPCGVWHDRDINAAQNILRRAELPASLCGNEFSILRIPPSASIPFAQGRDRNRKIQGMSTGLVCAVARRGRAAAT
jgi:transposase